MEHVNPAVAKLVFVTGVLGIDVDGARRYGIGNPTGSQRPNQMPSDDATAAGGRAGALSR